MNASSDKVQQP